VLRRHRRRRFCKLLQRFLPSAWSKPLKGSI
jgi:hypothetical protein